ncbi:MAG TPA: cytochrome C oxidase subunit IV family protein [Terriglobia bacterium]|nr:cytochrome C oxidase subunit IV family protein [Terriglobia bacterium]HTY84833.1 cytochrome C oxidase subunit IV family protein [Silvibacterium sp.]
MSELTQKEILDTEPTHHAGHIVSPKVYGVIFGALLVLTASTVGAAYLELGPFNVVVALAIACIKAVLVILFFMHVKYSSRLTKLTVAAGFFTFLVLITMALTDYISRAWGMW